MAIHKVTFIFEVRKHGWSESFYIDGTSLKQVEEGPAKDLRDTRRMLLARNTLIVGQRTTLVSNRGPSSMAQLAVSNNFNTESLVRDTPSHSMLVRFETGEGYRRMFHLRGAPDDWLKYSVKDDVAEPSPIMLGFLGSFFRKLVGDHWKLRVLSKDPADTLNTPITGLAVDATNIVTVTAPGHAVTLGEVVQIALLQGDNVSQFNGLHRARAVVPGVSFSFYVRNLTTPWLYNGFGIVRMRRIVFRDITSGSWQRFGKRNTGRAFFVEAGRHKRPKKVL